jgi:hypothetical protein
VMVGNDTPIKGDMMSEVPVTPEASLKEPNYLELWTEVVRRVDAKIGIQINMIRLTPMIGAFWNVMGLNKTGRLSCLGDFIKQYKLDFVGIVETKKASIADSFLRATSNKMT